MKTTALWFGLLLLVATPAFAQVDTSKLSGASATGGAADNPNPLNPTGGGLDMFSLIHQSNLANPTTPQQFTKRLGSGIDDAVAKFRARSVLKITPELIKTEEPSTASPTATSTTP
jgi:hypothetical protein